MKHFKKIKSSCNNFNETIKHPKNVINIAVKLSNRIDLLEKWISDNTCFDGAKIGYRLNKDYRDFGEDSWRK